VLGFGEPAPWFHCRTTRNPAYAFDTVAGRYVVLCFFGSAADPASRQVLDALAAERARFDDRDLCFFGVATDPDDERLARVRDALPGVRYFWDADGAVSALYGARSAGGALRRITYVLDPRLRVLAALPFDADPAGHVARLLALLDGLPPIGEPVAAAPHAPVLVVPRVFEPELCRDLIGVYERAGGRQSGFMRDIDGRTKLVVDPAHKRRRDRRIDDERLRRRCMAAIHDRLAPEIAKAFQFRATRMERYIVACYDAAEGGHFRAHRDNTTRGTAHRRFAVSLFLNTGEYEGGLLGFPEFGRQLYTAGAGGAVVFGCSLLHEATPVTRGRRYMFLPFLYDDAAAAIRAQNRRYLDDAAGRGSDASAGDDGE
jgi:predicted 2-oxoglutarate/Fe(II)-dependent dioxygenase YbiX/peroxiredoxin